MSEGGYSSSVEDFHEGGTKPTGQAFFIRCYTKPSFSPEAEPCERHGRYAESEPRRLIQPAVVVAGLSLPDWTPGELARRRAKLAASGAVVAGL